MKTARGNAKVTITNGVVKNLALVKSAVAATSLDPQAVVASSQGPHDEPFSELGASLSISAERRARRTSTLWRQTCGSMPVVRFGSTAAR